MSALWDSPHLILLLLLVPLTGLFLRWLSQAAVRLATWLHTRQIVRLAADVGVHVTDLLGTGTRSDAMILILGKIRDESYLLVWRLLRDVEQAGRDGVEGMDITAASIRRYLEEVQQCPVDAFHGFTIPTDSPYASRRPGRTVLFNRRMRRLRTHWRWASHWQWYRRMSTPRH